MENGGPSAARKKVVALEIRFAIREPVLQQLPHHSLGRAADRQAHAPDVRQGGIVTAAAKGQDQTSIVVHVGANVHIWSACVV